MIECLLCRNVVVGGLMIVVLGFVYVWMFIVKVLLVKKGVINVSLFVKVLGWYFEMLSGLVLLLLDLLRDCLYDEIVMCVYVVEN